MSLSVGTGAQAMLTANTDFDDDHKSVYSATSQLVSNQNQSKLIEHASL